LLSKKKAKDKTMQKQKYLFLLSLIAVWFGVGSMLLIKGIKMLIWNPNMRLCLMLGGNMQAVLWLIAIGLFFGFIKGRMVFSKVTKKIIFKIQEKSIAYVAVRQMMIIVPMMTLGMLLPKVMARDILSVMDIAVGSALMHGALFLIRWSVYLSKKRVSE
jgi:hypothetical protein